MLQLVEKDEGTAVGLQKAFMHGPQKGEIMG